MVAKSILHHLRNHRMIRFPCKYQQSMVSHGLKEVQEILPSTVWAARRSFFLRLELSDFFWDWTRQDLLLLRSGMRGMTRLGPTFPTEHQQENCEGFPLGFPLKPQAISARTCHLGQSSCTTCEVVPAIQINTHALL